MLRLKKGGKVIGRFRSWTDVMRFIIKRYKLKNFEGFTSIRTKVGVVDLELRLGKSQKGKAKFRHRKARKR